MTNAKMLLDQSAENIRIATQRPADGKITNVLQQVTLETGIIGGQAVVQNTINGIAQEVTDNIQSPLSDSITSLAELQESGKIGTSNDVIFEIAVHLSFWRKLK